MKFSLLFLALLQLEHSAAKRDTPCDIPCSGGACVYRECSEPVSCPGGACKFVNCQEAICEGGGCQYDGGKGGKCTGGGCDFHNTIETLKPGYCEGEGCKLEGKPHPSMRSGYLTQ